MGRDRLEVIFLESICNDPRVLESNLQQKVRHSPDYKDLPMEEALRDLRERIRNYERVYETIDERLEALSYIKLIDLREKVVLFGIRSPRAHAIVSYLMSIHVEPRCIWIVRAGHALIRDAGVVPHEAAIAEVPEDAEDGGGDGEGRPALVVEAEPGLGSHPARTTATLSATSAAEGASAVSPQAPRPSVVGPLTTPTLAPAPISRGLTPTSLAALSAASRLTGMGRAFSRAVGDYVAERCRAWARTGAAASAAERAAAEAAAERAATWQGGGSDTTPAVGASSTVVATTTTPEEALSSMEWDPTPVVFTSTLPRTMETAECLGFPSEQWSALNPMDTGIYAGVPLQSLESFAPQEYNVWKRAPDPVSHRITGGESIADVVNRLEPVVIELERQRRPVMIITHLSVVQILLAYFRNLPLRDCIDLDIPPHTVVELEPHQYGWHERHIRFCPEDELDAVHGRASGGSAEAPRGGLPTSPTTRASEAASVSTSASLNPEIRPGAITVVLPMRTVSEAGGFAESAGTGAASVPPGSAPASSSVRSPAESRSTAAPMSSPIGSRPRAGGGLSRFAHRFQSGFMDPAMMSSGHEVGHDDDDGDTGGDGVEKDAATGLRALGRGYRRGDGRGPMGPDGVGGVRGVGVEGGGSSSLDVDAGPEAGAPGLFVEDGGAADRWVSDSSSVRWVAAATEDVAARKGAVSGPYGEPEKDA